MMNKYIKIVMKPTPNGIGGEFSTFASFKIDNIDTPFQNVIVKIDTGCSISTIPLAKFKPLTHMLNILKKKDIISNIEHIRSYGVESGGKKHNTPITLDEKIKCEALKFKHSITDFSINEISIKHDFIYLNYNRSGNILIGMDIMKNWDIHIGTVDTGETIFLACPKDKINEEYLIELERLFHVHSLIDSTITRQKIEQAKGQII